MKDTKFRAVNDKFTASHNRSEKFWKPEYSDAAVYVDVKGRDGFYHSASLSTTEAQELIEVLQAIIADYPKEPTNEEILKELPVGSVVSNTGGTYVKAGDKWFGAATGMNWTVNKNYDWANNYGPLVVKYRGDE